MFPALYADKCGATGDEIQVGEPIEKTGAWIYDRERRGFRPEYRHSPACALVELVVEAEVDELALFPIPAAR